ncbi:MAG TPA: hypothetical protein VLL73_03460 [Desulfurivibrionaceae bacterium]|nr:hypothetical protein [Desulfurivibrionaceae bacterium]
MRRKPLLIAISLAAMLLWSGTASADQRCATLITTRCEQCHYKARICQALGSKSKSEWTRTVKRMQESGAKINQEEAKYLAACLAAAPVGAPHVCKDN